MYVDSIPHMLITAALLYPQLLSVAHCLILQAPMIQPNCSTSICHGEIHAPRPGRNTPLYIVPLYRLFPNVPQWSTVVVAR